MKRFGYEIVIMHPRQLYYGKYNHEISLSDLNSGIYVLRIVSKKGNVLYTNKFIKR